MGYFNIKLDDLHTQKFKELKTLLKCKNNDELVGKLIIMAQDYLQQKLLKSSNLTPPNQHNNKASKLPNNHNKKTS